MYHTVCSNVSLFLWYVINVVNLLNLFIAFVILFVIRKEAMLHGHRANFRSKRFRKHNNRALNFNTNPYQFKHDNRYKHNNLARSRRGHFAFSQPNRDTEPRWRTRHREEILDAHIIASPSQVLMGGPEVELSLETDSYVDSLPLTNDENSPYVYDGLFGLYSILPLMPPVLGEDYYN